MDILSLGYTALAILVAATVLSALISSVTGMAGGILMFTAMGVYIPMQALIPIHGAVQVFANSSRSWLLRQHLRGSMCLPFTAGALLGATLTTAFIARYLSELIPLMILCALIGYTLLRPAQLPQIKLRDSQFFWVGLATGSVGIIAGAVDPLLAAFFMRDDLQKEEVVANKSMMQLVTHLTKLPAFIYLGFVFQDYITLIVVFSIAAIIGSQAGVVLLRMISRDWFFRLMRWGLALAGIRVLYQLISQWSVLPLFLPGQ